MTLTVVTEFFPDAVIEVLERERNCQKNERGKLDRESCRATWQRVLSDGENLTAKLGEGCRRLNSDTLGKN